MERQGTEDEAFVMPTRKGTHARRRLIETAVELFETRGYEGASVREIAEATGVAKATLYHYFSSKSALLFAIHDEFMLVLEEGMAAIEARDLEPQERLRAIIRDLWRVMRVNRGEVRVFFEEWRHVDGDHLEGLRERRDAYTGFVRSAVDAVIDEAELKVSDDEAAALTLAVFGMCNWAYQWFDPDGPLTEVQLADLYADLALRGLCDNGKGVG